MRTENKGKVGEKMRQVLLGYRIENGEAKIEEAGANKVRSLFEAYNDGLSIKNAAEKARISGYPTCKGCPQRMSGVQPTAETCCLLEKTSL